MAHTPRLCPECVTNPAPDQRDQARDGRCEPCVKRLARERRRAKADVEDPWALLA